jgi:hypothetical protein
MDAATLASVCRWPGDPKVFFKAMRRSGFVDVENRKIIAHGWTDANGKLIAAWKNGAQGGRPPQTHTEPDDNPQDTQGVPKQDKQNQTNQIDKKELDEQNQTEGTGRNTETAADSESAFLRHVSDSGWTVVEAVKFAATGNRNSKGPNSTMIELASRLPEQKVLALAAKAYAGKNDKTIREPGAWLTDQLKRLAGRA